MFDEVIAQCPGCGKNVCFQSKAGACILDTFRANKVPVDIAIDLDGSRDNCPNCQRVVILRSPVKGIVAMKTE